MKRLLLASFGALILASCGQSDYNTLVDACVEGGEARAKCTCMADIAQDKLSPEAFETFAELVKQGENADVSELENMSPGDMLAIGTVGVEAASTCQ